jgi:FKBP-type peptidyl-prolyl cis-trans isomerase (trigger factor)
MMPHVKDIQWDKDSEFKAVVEIEHEPAVEIQVSEPLQVPHEPVSLDDEVERFLKQMAQENATYLQVEEVIADDAVECEITFTANDEAHTLTGLLFGGEAMPQRSIPELIGKKVGDVVESSLTGNTLKLTTKAKLDKLDNDTGYPCSLMINDIRRYKEPAIDDEFAKDMDFDDLAAMKAKIAEDMRLRVEHTNYDAENSAIIRKLYADNPFELPKRTIEHLAQEESAKIADQRYRQYYEYQFRMQFSQQMINIYTLKALNRLLEPSIDEAMLESYIEHEAILEDIPVGAWKEKHADRLNSEELKDEARSWKMLRDLAEKAEFVKPEPPAPELEASATESDANYTDYETIKEEA